MAENAPIETPDTASECQTRRDCLDSANYVTGPTGDGIDPAQPIGIAFSGGGIRSATVSLGIAQALARRERLLTFDYMSTVSGGGYFGGFLRSLFIPAALRGPSNQCGSEPGAVEQDKVQVAFAMAALSAPANAKTVPPPSSAPAGTGDYTSPVWWLRENGRYLAPNGTADYLYALSYISRNWLSLIYTISLPLVLLFLALHLIIAGSYAVLPSVYSPLAWQIELAEGWMASPLIGLAIVVAGVALSFGFAYWTTEGMPSITGWVYPRRSKPDETLPEPLDPLVRTIASARSWRSRMRNRPTSQFWLTWTMAVSGMMLVGWFLFGRLRWIDMLPKLGADALRICYGIVTLSMVIAALTCLKWERRAEASEMGKLTLSPFLTASTRRSLTKGLTTANTILVALLALAVIDTIAIHLRQTSGGSLDSIFDAIVVLANPLIAFIVSKASGWFSQDDGTKKSGISGFFARQQGLIKAAAGILLFASLAILVDLIVLKAMWWDEYPSPDADLASVPTALLAILALTLALVAGYSDGFINLSSLHSFYASRLTRAYLGATNLERLAPETTREEKRVVADDFIHVEPYQRHQCAAPMHLVNVTLNVTKGDAAQAIVRRDRKGQQATFGPDGLWIEGDHFSWDDLKAQKAEPLSVGQVVAISGAAASSGMGRATSIGSSLALGFANIRLGYWWRFRGEDSVSNWPKRLTITFIYLYNELLGRFSKKYQRYYLSDGGHSENSGALALLRRGCRLIVVADNEQDQGYAFEALEILMRTARIDLGMEIELVDCDRTAALVGEKARSNFFNCEPGDWRECMRKSGGSAFAVLLSVRKTARSYQPPDSYIIWMKPRVLDGMPIDIISYDEAHPDFPHQTTGDQFFDESQWESYHRLGYELASRMFGTRTGISEGLLPYTRLRTETPGSAKVKRPRKATKA